MDTRISTNARIATLITAALDGTLTEQQAEQLAGVDDDLGKLAWRLATITSALRAYLNTGQLPPLPVQSVADG